MTTWLNDDQQRAWRQLAAVILKLPAELDAQLQRDAGMTHFEYWVLALLSEEPDRRLQMSVLAAQANASLSRLSHVVSRLERRGWVTREISPDDARARDAVLTDVGYEKIVDTAPSHVTTVRELVFADLSAQQVAALEDIAGTIAARLNTGS